MKKPQELEFCLWVLSARKVGCGWHGQSQGDALHLGLLVSLGENRLPLVSPTR